MALAEQPPPPRGAADWLVVPARLLALILLAMGAGKLGDLPGFLGILGTYRLVPAPLLGPLGLLVAVGELAAALGLLLPAWRRGAALVVAGLVLAAGAAMALALLRGLPLVNSGQFGVFLPRPADALTLLQDGLLLALALLVLVGDTPEPRA